MGYTIGFWLGKLILPAIVGCVVWFVSENKGHRKLRAVISFLIVLVLLLLPWQNILHSDGKNDATEAASSTTEIETEPTPVYATSGDIQVEITGTNYKRVKSYKNLKFLYAEESTDEDDDEDESKEYRDFSDKKKKGIWNDIVPSNGVNVKVYQDSISANILALYKADAADIGYDSVDEFIEDYNFSDDVTVDGKHIDVAGTHAYMALEYAKSKDVADCSETLLIHNGTAYVIAFYAFSSTTDLEDKTKELISKTSFK